MKGASVWVLLFLDSSICLLNHLEVRRGHHLIQKGLYLCCSYYVYSLPYFYMFYWLLAPTLHHFAALPILNQKIFKKWSIVTIATGIIAKSSKNGSNIHFPTKKLLFFVLDFFFNYLCINFLYSNVNSLFK